MSSPYINTILFSNVTLYPHQMNNDLYQNLKRNLIEEVKGKCFGDYGYIVDVFEIRSYKTNRIEAENTSASCVFDVEFSCRLCRPLNESSIVCKIDKAHKVLLRCVNGPINVIVTSERVNSDEFFRDNNLNLRYKVEGGSQQLGPDNYVKVRIINYSFLNKDTKIVCLGFLESIASQEDIQAFFKDQHDNKGKLVSYEEYIGSLNFKEEDDDDVEIQDEDVTENTDNYVEEDIVEENTTEDED